MIKDKNDVTVSGKIFWSKLDERENYSILRLGIDIGEGNYNRVFATISNPHEKAHQFVKNDNQIILMGAWLDVWNKDDGTSELQIKAYDSNCQFYLPEATIPHFNQVIIYGTVNKYEDNRITIDCIGNRNPKTGEYTHRYVYVDIEDTMGDIIGKKLLIRGTLGSEKIDEKRSVLKIFADYDKINIMA